VSRLVNFLRGGFGGAKPEAETIRRVKAWITAALDAHPGTTIAVNEIACADPSCPGIETVILIMEPGRKTRACKVQKPIEDVTEADVRAALAEAGA
jgi:hypothetical protein